MTDRRRSLFDFLFYATQSSKLGEASGGNEECPKLDADQSTASAKPKVKNIRVFLLFLKFPFESHVFSVTFQ